MRKILTILSFIVALLVTCTIPTHTQTPQAVWVQPSVASTTQAAGFTYRLYTTPFGLPTNPPVILSGVVCTGTIPAGLTGDVNCTAPLGPAVAAAALASGAKTTLGAQDGTTAEAMSAPFSPGASAPRTFLVR